MSTGSYYKQSKNLGNLIGSKTIDNKVVHKNKSKKKLYCRPQLITREDNCYQKYKQTVSKLTELAKRLKFHFHQLNCKSSTSLTYYNINFVKYNMLQFQLVNIFRIQIITKECEIYLY